MRPRVPIRFALLLLTVPATGCGGNPQVKYRSGDRTAAAGQTEEWTFDKDAAGKPPAGAGVFRGTWKVRPESDAPSPSHALCQTGRVDFPAVRLGDKVYVD